MNYFLDTNSLWYFLESVAYSKNIPLESKLKKDSEYVFTVSEITMLEIYSVLGKYGRGKNEQRNICSRQIYINGNLEECKQEYIEIKRKKLSTNLLQAFKKIIDDMEQKRGFIKADVVRVDSNSLTQSKNLLIKYAIDNKFESLDSVVAGCFLKLNVNDPWTIVTADQRFQSILKQEKITFYDPLKDSLITP